MTILFTATFILSLCYAFMLLYHFFAWQKKEIFEIDKVRPLPKISVVIAARNEENTLPKLLLDLDCQSLSKSQFEVIVVDDHSTDLTVKKTNTSGMTNLTVISLSANSGFGNAKLSYKKKALEMGIQNSRNELIVTTDADCRVEPEWLEIIATAQAASNAQLISAPIAFFKRQGFLYHFQSLDLMGLMAITGGAFFRGHPFLANGANMAYTRSTYVAVEGFEQIKNIPSGDDMLLLEKINQQFPGKALFIKSNQAIVKTPAAGSWKAFWNQRLRWTSKTGHYRQWGTKLALVMAFLYNLLLFALFVSALWHLPAILFFILALVPKLLAEFFLINSTVTFFNRKSELKWFLPCSIFHIIYVLVLGVLTNFKSYEWKGRRY